VLVVEVQSIVENYSWTIVREENEMTTGVKTAVVLESTTSCVTIASDTPDGISRTHRGRRIKP